MPSRGRPHRLAHGAGVAEHAQEVVLELKGLAHRGAVAARARRAGGRRAGQQGAELDRPLGGIAPGLEAQHPQQLVLARRPAAAPQQLQVLAADDLLAHGREAAPAARRRAGSAGQAGRQLDRPALGQVAEQDRHRAAEIVGVAPEAAHSALAEAGVGGGLAAPHLGVVHDVVVDQQVGVEQLRGQGEGQGLRIRGAAAAEVGVVDQGGAQPLAALGGELGDAVDQLAQGVGLRRGRSARSLRLASIQAASSRSRASRKAASWPAKSAASAASGAFVAPHQAYDCTGIETPMSVTSLVCPGDRRGGRWSLTSCLTGKLRSAR